MKSKDKKYNNKDKEKKIILWEVKSFPAVEITRMWKKRETRKPKIETFMNDSTLLSILFFSFIMVCCFLLMTRFHLPFKDFFSTIL